MKQGDFALQTNGEGVYRKDGVTFRCLGMSAAAPVDEDDLQIGKAFTPDPMNDPENPEAVEWFKAMQGVSES